MINIYTCESCNRVFNFENRKPILLPCNDTVCYECVQSKILSPTYRQSSGQLTCCLDPTHSYKTVNCNRINNFVLRRLSDQEIVTIVCDDHPDMFAQYTCKQCSKFICEICVAQKHKTHQSGSKSQFLKEELLDYLLITKKVYKETINQLDYHFQNVKSLAQNQVLKDKEFRRSCHLITQFLIIFADRQEPMPEFESILKVLDCYSLRNSYSQNDFLSHLNLSWENGLNLEASLNRASYFNSQKHVQQQSGTLVQIPIISPQPAQIQVQRQPEVISQQKLPNISNQLPQANTQIIQNQNNSVNSLKNLNQVPAQSLSSMILNQSRPQQLDANLKNSQNQSALQIDLTGTNENSSKILQNQRIAPAIQVEPHYQEFIRLVDNEILKKKESVLGNSIPGFKDISFKLLYQGTRDGFTAEQLQSRLKLQKSTHSITFVLSNLGSVFGGFQTVQRCFPKLKTNIYDKQAFVFQLNKRQILPRARNCQNQILSLTNQREYLCEFGATLILQSNCNIDWKSCNSFMCGCFTYPQELKNQVEGKPGLNSKEDHKCQLDHVDISSELYEKRRSYLAGARKFTVHEIEIYEIDLPQEI
eukprot:403359191